jgi:hypothetical protein
MFGDSKRQGADEEIQEMATWVLGQSVVIGSSFPPVGVFENRLQMAAALEACAFFLHAVDRLAYRPADERLREAVFDAAVRQMIRTFSDMIFKAWAPSSLSEIEQDNLSLFNARQLEFGRATHLISKEFNDLNSASWLAAHNVARAGGIAEPDIRIAVFHNALMKSLLVMDLANRIKTIENCLA